jgi:hypothetical protein
MTERDDARAEEEAALAAAEAGSIGGRAPDEEDPARRPVDEAGGGESEGAELIEDELRDRIEGVERSHAPDARAEGEPDTFDEPA